MEQDVLERLRRVLALQPDGCWQEHMIPTAALIEVLEVVAGICRACGDEISAGDLDDLRRNFLANRDAALQHREEDDEEEDDEEEPLSEPENPALRERWRRVPGTLAAGPRPGT